MVVSLGIRSVPTIKSFSDGKEVATRVGLLQEGQLHEMAKGLING
jgi:thioredoxin-like negative regulator of GroEL